jgi:hypothetical protein
MENPETVFELYKIFNYHASRVTMLASVNPEQAEAHEKLALSLIEHSGEDDA